MCRAISEGASKLIARYGLLQTYFESRLPLWGLSKIEAQGRAMSVCRKRRGRADRSSESDCAKCVSETGVLPVQDFKQVKSLRNDLNALSMLCRLTPVSLEAVQQDGFHRNAPTFQIPEPNPAQRQCSVRTNNFEEHTIRRLCWSSAIEQKKCIVGHEENVVDELWNPYQTL